MRAGPAELEERRGGSVPRSAGTAQVALRAAILLLATAAAWLGLVAAELWLLLGR